MTTLLIDVDEFPNLKGQEVGRELELELTVVVTSVLPDRTLRKKVAAAFGVDPEVAFGSVGGGLPSGAVILAVTRVDITQTT